MALTLITADNIDTTTNPTVNAITVSTNTATIGTAAYFLANGNVGIGTNASGAKLSLSTTNATQAFRVDESTSGYTYTQGMDDTGVYFKHNSSSRNFRWGNTTTEWARIDSSGNMGIGVTPNAWSTVTALQMAGPSMWGSAGVGHWSLNTYFDGTYYKYINTGAVTDYYQLSGTHVWRYAASGTAGANVSLSEAMRIDSSGNVSIGNSTDNSTRVLNFITTSGGSSSIQSVTVGATNQALTFSTTYSTFAERMRITGDGNLGIGTTSPALKTTIEANGAQLRIRNTTTRYRSDYAVDSAGTSSLVTYDDTGAVYKQMNIYASPLTFNTTSAGAETMRIDSSGNMMVGATTASGKFTVVQNAVAIGGYFQSTTATAGYHGVYAEANNSYGVYGKTYNASYGGVLGYNSNNTAFGILGYLTYGFYSASSINVAGTVYTSDARLKENVKPILNSLDILSALNPVSFDWKEKSSRGPSSDFGLIAQEVEQVIPECVFETTTPGRTPEMTHEVSLEEELGTYKGVDYSRFIPFLIAAVKELSDKNTALEDRIKTLENNK